MSISHRLRTRLAGAALGVVLVVTACSTDAEVEAGPDDVENASAIDIAEVSFSDDVALFDSSVVHDIEIELDEEDYAQMIETYETTGEKDWISVTVTIDGTTIEDAGLRLKGNSSLFGLTTETADAPEELPWLVQLDEFVDDQSYQGYTDLVIRSNSTETAMNEAVAVELLGVAGLATQEAIATTLTVNGGETELRLAMEHPDEIWAEDEFGDDDGLLYKADSEGDYSYRGDDPDAYDDVFDQKAGDDDLEPLIEFLDFVNNADDATFAAELGDHLDVDDFATYLAFQELIGNFDDIDGPGNNSYLYLDPDTDRFTVVNWDLNLAFDTANVGGGGPGLGGPGVGGPGGDAGRGGPPVGGPGGPGGAFGGNVLSERFLADDDFAALYEEALVELRAAMYDSGAANDIVTTWTEVLTDQASELVDVSTIEAEAAAILVSIQGA
ncbi:MAG: CotH kinase family protein [Actinomycetota bacterium]